ncbi:hypothetical protein HDV63DRAFT_271135 [Trichoderma sp. SZMC 28014]
MDRSRRLIIAWLHNRDKQRCGLGCLATSCCSGQPTASLRILLSEVKCSAITRATCHAITEIFLQPYTQRFWFFFPLFPIPESLQHGVQVQMLIGQQMQMQPLYISVPSPSGALLVALTPRIPTSQTDSIRQWDKNGGLHLNSTYWSLLSCSHIV